MERWFVFTSMDSEHKTFLPVTACPTITIVCWTLHGAIADFCIHLQLTSAFQKHSWTAQNYPLELPHCNWSPSLAHIGDSTGLLTIILLSVLQCPLRQAKAN